MDLSLAGADKYKIILAASLGAVMTFLYTHYFIVMHHGLGTVEFGGGAAFWSAASPWRFFITYGTPFAIAALLDKNWRGQYAIYTSLMAWLVGHTIGSVMEHELVFCPPSLITLYPLLGAALILGHTVGRVLSLFLPGQAAPDLGE